MIPTTQTGYGFKRGSRSIVKYELPVKQPQANEVLLKVEAAGMCQSDLHILIAQEKHTPDEFVMGHEVAGKIVAAGPGLENSPYRVGGRFSLLIVDACGTCRNCRQGKDNGCVGKHGLAYGLTQDGGYQEYLLVKNLHSLTPIADNVSYEHAAVATDLVLTPFHAIQKVRQLLQPTTKVLIIGLGGLGLNAVQIIKTYGCYAVTSDIKPSSEEIAREFGANEFYTDLSQSPHKPESFDICIDLVGNQESFNTSQKYVKNQGKILMVGLARAKFLILNYQLARREVEIIFLFGGTSAEQEEVMRWLALGKITPVVSTAPLSELPKYLDKLARGEVTGRVVFHPGPASSSKL